MFFSTALAEFDDFATSTRMKAPKQNRRTGIFTIFGVGILFIVAVVLFLPDILLYEKLEPEINRIERRLGEAIARRHGLHLLVTFDETPPIERISNTRLLQSGIQAVPGRFGDARHFDGRSRTFIATQQNWAELGNRFTISLWVKIKKSSPNQAIVYAATHQGDIGLVLQDGNLTFHVPENNPPVSYTFNRFDEFVHITAVADEVDGYAALYENGREMARSPVEKVRPPYHNIVFSMNRWSHSHTPFLGIIDEVTVWNRALPLGEIRTLSQRNRSLMPGLRLDRHVRAKSFTALTRSIRATRKIMDAFNVFLHPGHASGADLPELNMYLSKADLRYLRRGHYLRASTGYLVRDAARPRKIRFYYNGTPGSGRLRLHADSAGENSKAGRMGFVLSSNASDSPLELSRIRISPPENAGFMEPLFETELARELNLPHIKNGLLRLRINGAFHGVYYFEDFERMGIYPGQGGERHWGTRHPADWRSLFRPAVAPRISRAPLDANIPFDENVLQDLYGKLVSRYERALVNDVFSPLSSREIRHRIRHYGGTLSEHFDTATENVQKSITVRDALKETMLLGNNPSPLFIVENLDLEAFGMPGITITWRSETPDSLRDDGTVIRPAGGTAPVDAHLTAIVSDGQSQAETTLRFRIMPAFLGMPAVMLYANEDLGRRRRVDAIAHYHPVDSSGVVPRVLTATSWSGGGISHRGNTSHWEFKKPFNLRCDEPHRLLRDTGTRHLLFAPGSRDPSFMRNRLSYDLFRALSTPSAPRVAPHLTWVEIFFNGEYFGLYEMKTRIDRHALGFPAYRAGMENHARLFKTVVQKYPTSRWGSHSQDYLETRQALANTPRPQALATLASRFDLDNAVDFHLLLNIVEGADNMTDNYIIARRPGPGEKYEYVAWDMKRTFRGGDRYYTHHFARHAENADAFQNLLHQRWVSVRDGFASADSLLRQIDVMETKISPYIPWEFERWGFNQGRTYKELVNEIRSNILYRLAILDQRYGTETGDQNVSPSD